MNALLHTDFFTLLSLCRSHPTPIPISLHSLWTLDLGVDPGFPLLISRTFSAFLSCSSPLLCASCYSAETLSTKDHPVLALGWDAQQCFSQPTSDKFLAVAGNWHRVPQLNNVQGVGNYSIFSPKRDTAIKCLPAWLRDPWRRGGT